MKNINLFKVANVLALCLTLMLVVSPLLASAQFNKGLNNVESGAGEAGVATEADFGAIALKVINVLLAIAGLIAVIFLIVGGFRYVTAGGNEEAAESGKKTITNAIIGIVIIILSFVIVRVVSNALINSTTSS